ncbi:MAG: histidinol-phosphate transaminase [Promethearchaeota archaeon]
MGDISHLLKPYILESEPYSPTAILRMLYEVRSDYTRLMGNEIPFGISPKVRQAIIDMLPKAHLYPDSSYYDLKQALAKYTGFTDNHLAVANGSTQFIDAFYYGFIETGDSVLFVPPDYGPYRIRLKICGGAAQLAPRLPPDYSWNIDNILDAITPKTKVLVIVSPNNPVGNCIGEADFRRILEENLLVVLDEAYFEFSDETLAHLVNNYSNLVVTRTFAKAFGFAGLRLGYAITTAQLATYLTKVLHHFPVNSLTAIGAIAALEDKDYLEFVQREIRAGRRYLEDELNRLSDVHAFPSKANFVLCQFKAPNISSYDITQKLIERGIIVRDYSGKAGLEGQFIRITVGTMDQNKACVRAISEIL